MEGDNDQESIQSSTTHDPGYHMGKWQKTQLNITNESQEQVTKRQHWMDSKACQTQDIDNTNYPQKKYRLGTVSKNILPEGLNRFHSANLTLSHYNYDFCCKMVVHHKAEQLYAFKKLTCKRRKFYTV